MKIFIPNCLVINNYFLNNLLVDSISINYLIKNIRLANTQFISATRGVQKGL